MAEKIFHSIAIHSWFEKHSINRLVNITTFLLLPMFFVSCREKNESSSAPVVKQAETPKPVVEKTILFYNVLDLKT